MAALSLQGRRLPSIVVTSTLIPGSQTRGVKLSLRATALPNVSQVGTLRLNPETRRVGINTAFLSLFRPTAYTGILLKTLNPATRQYGSRSPAVLKRVMSDSSNRFYWK